MKLATLLAPCILLTTSLTAQNLMHYKFDERCGAEVVNFAPGTTLGNAAIVTTEAGGPDAARVAGQFDQAMTGAFFPGGAPKTYLDTGWAPVSTTGSFSFAMWLRNRPGNPASIPFCYLFGATTATGAPLANFRLFTGSSGRLFLSGFPGAATSAANLSAQLNAGWVHVACTVDGSAMQATWYVNGVADPAVSFTQPVFLAGSNFAIGARETTSGSNPSPLDTDEFLFTESVWTPTEVLALSLAPRAGDGDYTSGTTTQCGAGNVVLGSTGGAPALGNLAYSLTVTTTTPSLFLLLAGFDKCNFGGSVPLPLDGTPLLPLLSGCWILADAPVTLSGVTTAGPTTLALPIPATVPVSTHIYTQVLSLDLATFASSMSSGFVSSTGS